jgi:transposase
MYEFLHGAVISGSNDPSLRFLLYPLKTDIGRHANEIREGPMMLKRSRDFRRTAIPSAGGSQRRRFAMMGRRTSDQSQLFYLFNLEERIPAGHLLRRINPIVTWMLADLREKLTPFYSDLGRPSIDPELMIRMLIVGYCYAIRFERRLCEEVDLHLAYRWFCRLDLEARVPNHSTFSVNRHGRFRDGGIFRQIFEAVVRA